jgi:hypothetical protein
MPSGTNLLDPTEKRYAINRNQSIVVWTATSPQDPNFNIQLRFIQDNAKKIDFARLLENLKGRIQPLNIILSNKLFFKKKDDIKEFLDSLKDVGINPKSAQLIKDKKTLYESVESELFKESNKELLALLTTRKIKTLNDKTLYFGYKISEELRSQASSFDKGHTNCVCIFNEKKTKQLINKVYLFPTDEASLEKAQESIKNVKDINTLNLEIPFVAYDPKLSNDFYNKDIQIRIDLQTIIAEILIHLKQVGFFRKDNATKTLIFKDLAKDIASGKPLAEIEHTLNQHDKWAVLAQHRDPWGFFAFFKGEPHSLVAWNCLKETLSSVELNANNAATLTYN